MPYQASPGIFPALAACPRTRQERCLPSAIGTSVPTFFSCFEDHNMKKSFSSPFARPLATLLILLFAVSPAWATCGGGGGGGGGGMPKGGSGGGSSPEVYFVPLKVRAPNNPPAKGLVLYWFPASKEEIQKSSLRTSPPLSLY